MAGLPDISAALATGKNGSVHDQAEEFNQRWAAGGLRLYREGVESSGSLRKVSGYISILLSRTCPVARVVYAKRPFAGPATVLAYLGHYTHRVAIANSRLIALTGGQVSFRWRDYRHHHKNKVMTLAADEFIRRFLLHALPDWFHRIRHYGFLANRHRTDKLARCRELLSVAAPASAHDDGEPRHLPDPAPDLCPCCGGRMELIVPLPRSRPANHSTWHDSS